MRRLWRRLQRRWYDWRLGPWFVLQQAEIHGISGSGWTIRSVHPTQAEASLVASALAKQDLRIVGVFSLDTAENILGAAYIASLR